MELVTQASVDAYLQDDAILRMLDATAHDGDEALTCQRWLRTDPAKRLVFRRLYGDLMEGPRRKVLDVGGGLTSLTRTLAQLNHYSLIDIMAHDHDESVRSMVASLPAASVLVKDWYEAEIVDAYDVILANDLFPNVDQRLDLFLQKALPRAREVRLALTYYNVPRFYRTKRVDADEHLCMLAWDGAATRRCMEKYAQYVVDLDLDLFLKPIASPYANRRQVCLITLRR